MRKLLQFLAIFIAIIAPLGCRSGSMLIVTPVQSSKATMIPVPAVPLSHLPLLNGTWRIALTQSGGIMGLSRRVEILTGGEMIFTDPRSTRSKQYRLSEEKITVLVRLVSNSVYLPVEVPSRCADCFIFDLEIASADQKFQVQLNQIDLGNSGLEPLVNFLVEELNGVGK